MKCLLKWIVVSALVLLAFFIVGFAMLTGVVEERQQALVPLSDTTLQAILANARNAHAESEDQQSGPDVDASTANDATVELDRDAKVGRNPEIPARRLSITLSKDKTLDVFRLGDNVISTVAVNTRLALLRRMESLFWAANGKGNVDLTANLGIWEYCSGNLETGRRYLRQAVEMSQNDKDGFNYRDSCSKLAWAEDDPEIAAALLEASCSPLAPHYQQALFLEDAICLTVLTGSYELAEHYYTRWISLDPKVEFRGSVPNLIGRGGAEVLEEWLRERDPDFNLDKAKGIKS